MDPVVVVAPAGLEQEDSGPRIGRQAIGEQAAGGAGADDDVVEFFHRCPAFSFSARRGTLAVAPRLHFSPGEWADCLR